MRLGHARIQQHRSVRQVAVVRDAIHLQGVVVAPRVVQLQRVLAAVVHGPTALVRYRYSLSGTTRVKKRPDW